MAESGFDDVDLHDCHPAVEAADVEWIVFERGAPDDPEPSLREAAARLRVHAEESGVR